MPPFQYNHRESFISQSSEHEELHTKKSSKESSNGFKTQIVWRNVLNITLLHLLSFYGIFLSVTTAKAYTILWVYFLAVSSGFGVLVGSHRLWSHRSYKAHWSLRTLLMIMQTLALQNDIYEWARDHRVHHKYAETDADPHNSRRGFFFAHMGWLMMKKHPEVINKGKAIDLSDLWADPIVRFQRRFYIPLVLLIWGIIPISVPYYLWSEALFTSLCMNLLRYTVSLHQAWSVNSVAHMFGSQPYDKTIEPRESPSVIYLSFGEGYHNYHHTFPYDYSASELGWSKNFNPATAFIDLFACTGLAYDRRTASRDLVTARQSRTGDPHFKRKSNIRDFVTGIIIFTWPLWVMFCSKYIIQILTA